MSIRSRRVIWRVVPEATPRVARWCARCNKKSPFASTDRFRLNASGGRIDAWLIYRCVGCGTRWCAEIFERRHVSELRPAELEALQRNDRQLAWRFAFDLTLLGVLVDDLPWHIEQLCLDGEGPVVGEVTIELSYRCRVRLDRLLARQLAISRAAAKRMARDGELEIDPGGPAALRRPARDGQRIVITAGRDA